MKFIKLVKSAYDPNNLNTIDNTLFNKIKGKIQIEVNSFMDENFNPFEADSYEDAVGFCKTLMTSPRYYVKDNYENLLNKRIIDENIIKKIGKSKIINEIKKQLQYYGKFSLKDVKSDRDQWDDEFDEYDEELEDII